MNTKEKIIDTALERFSIHGYSSVSVRDLAKDVGIKESSLYNHFKNKQDIFDTIIEQCMDKVMKHYQAMRLDQTLKGDFTVYRGISESVLLNIAYDHFKFYVEDVDMKRFRRILVIEQFKNEVIQKLYHNQFFDGAIQFQTQLFKHLGETGYLKVDDPERLAYAFYTPIFFLMHRYDSYNDEVKHQLDHHIHHFVEHYKP